MCGVFDNIAREEIRKRGDEFIAAARAFADAANRLTAQLERLNTVLESGKLDSMTQTYTVGVTSGTLNDLIKQTRDVGNSFSSFSKALKELK